MGEPKEPAEIPEHGEPQPTPTPEPRETPPPEPPHTVIPGPEPTPTPTSEPPRRANKKDILAAPDVESAFARYHEARADKYANRLELMRTLSEKLMGLGHKDAAMQWTALAEQAETAEAQQETQRFFQSNVHELRNTVRYLGGISEEMGRNLTRGSEEMRGSADQFKMAVVRLEGVVEGLRKKGAHIANELNVALNDPARRMEQAAQIIDRASHRMSERGGRGY